MPDRSNKTKLLIVSDYFYPHWTGLAKSLYYFLGALDTEIQTTVLTVRFQSHLPKRDIVFHSPIYREDPLFSFSRAKYSVALVWQFLRLLPQHTTVFINSPNTNVVVLALLTKIFGKKLFIFHQGDLVLPAGVRNRIIEKIFDLSSFIAFRLADKVSTYSQDYAEHSRVLRPHIRKCTPLLFPIPHIYKPASLRRQTNKVIRFGFAGRFVQEKGFDILFRAIPQIVKSIPNVQFVFAGEIHMGYEDFFNQHKSLFERVKPHVQLLGLLDETALIDFYRSIDFLIVPSRSDCFNLVQAEAMACGTPSIASNIPGLRYLVAQTGFGKLFIVEDSSSLAEACINAVNERNVLQQRYPLVRSILDEKTINNNLRQFFLQ